MSIDMHCHLDLYPRPDLVAEESKRRGTYILSVTATPKAWHGTSLLAKESLTNPKRSSWATSSNRASKIA